MPLDETRDSSRTAQAPGAAGCRRWRCAAPLILASLLQEVHAGQAPAQVTIRDFQFEPMALTVPVGTRVQWTNQDEEAHTVVSDSGQFRSPALDTNDRFSFTFDKPGTYHFACSLHPQMVGTITVK